MTPDGDFGAAEGPVPDASPADAQTIAALAEVIADLKVKNDHLEAALKSSRRIGMALGILMAIDKLTPDQAFDALKRTSQYAAMKLWEVAEVVIETGSLDVDRRAPGSGRPS